MNLFCFKNRKKKIHFLLNSWPKSKSTGAFPEIHVCSISQLFSVNQKEIIPLYNAVLFFTEILRFKRSGRHGKKKTSSEYKNERAGKPTLKHLLTTNLNHTNLWKTIFFKDGAKVRTSQTNTPTKQQINVNYFVNI